MAESSPGVAAPARPAGPEPRPAFEAGEGRVLILGGGYAGVSTARALVARGYPAEKVVLLDREPSTTFRTELYRVAEALRASEAPSPWTFPFSRTALVSSGVRVVQGEALALITDERYVRTTAGDLPYDVLVLALGCVPAYYGIPGCKEHSEEVYTVPGALHLAQRLRALLTSTGGKGASPAPPLRVLVAGGGATGVELGAHVATSDWSDVLGHPVRPVKVTVLTGPAPFLAGLPERLVVRARKEVIRAGVEIVDGGQVTSVAPGRVEFKDLPPRSTDVFVWCGGLQAPDLVAGLPFPQGPARRTMVTPFLEVEGQPGVFALGDCAAMVDPYDGTPVPSTAQAALEQGPVAARNILARIKGTRFEVFHYEPRGVAIATGAGRAVAAVGHRVVGGRLAGIIKGLAEREYHAEVRGVVT